jgi:hypothetical protein
MLIIKVVQYLINIWINSFGHLKGGVMMQQTIRCSVSNCNYYGEGNYCQADAIVVHSDSAGHDNGMEQVTSSVTNNEVQSSATKSSETCCETFRPKY